MRTFPNFAFAVGRYNPYATNSVQPSIPVPCKIAEILNVDVRTLLIPNEITNKLYGEYESKRGQGGKER